jgi:hypothetical protein
MTAERGRLPRVVSVVAPHPGAGPRAFLPLTGHHSPEGKTTAPEFAEEQQE